VTVTRTRTRTWVGQAVQRVEDERLLKGEGQYVGDLSREGMLHAAILRSPIPHGVLKRIDIEKAKAMPGVRAIITAPEVERALGKMPKIPMRQDPVPSVVPFFQPVIAKDKVRYVGEPIAVVVADSRIRAEDAMEAIALDIEALPVVVDADAAEGAVRLFEGETSNCALLLAGVRGDADAAFENAPYRRRERFRVHRHTAVPMETRGVLAEWDAARKQLTFWGATKAPFLCRRILAPLFGMAEADIRMVEGDTGGSFGVRGEFYPDDFLIPFAARHVGRAVKWIETRSEHFIACNHSREADCELEIACTRDGTILGLRGRARTDIGAYVRTNGVTPSRNMAQVCSGPYRIPHVRFEVAMMLTNKTPVGTYRAPGRFETDFFRERLFDIVAGDLGIDRVEFRRRNLVAENEMPYSLPTLEPMGSQSECDSGNYRTTLERCLEEFRWPQKERLNGKLIDGRYHGIGIGCYIEGGASGPREGARLVLESDASFSVYTGSSANGQGLETVFSQIAADALGVPMNRIRGVFHGSTEYVKEGFGAFASRSIVMGGSAILLVAKDLKDRIRAEAGRRLGCNAEDIRLEDDHAHAPDGDAIGLGELAGINAEGSFSNSKRTYSYGAHAAHIAVDAATGRIEVLDYVGVEDVGRIVNPETLHGQALGAIVQGLSGVLQENLVYDDEAQLLSGSFADYAMPIAADFPHLHVVALEECPSPLNPLGAKGAGEGGIIPVGGVIANALAAALSALGVQPRELPLSAPRVWRLLNNSGSGT
jgi:aerobic carbon-monoxide dehydrogenase large subunit